MKQLILLAEDSEDDVFIFKQVLRKSGLKNPVCVVHDGDEAIAYLKGEGDFANREKYPMPGILVLDLKMPKVSGFQVLRWIKTQEQLKQLLIVVLSHVGETHEVSQAYFLGAHSFLTKPVTEEDLTNFTNHFNGFWQRISNQELP